MLDRLNEGRLKLLRFDYSQPFALILTVWEPGRIAKYAVNALIDLGEILRLKRVN